MTHPTSFPLDEATVKRLERLAALWSVSQAEVVRRAVEQAEAAVFAAKPDRVAMLRDLHASHQGLDASSATAYLREARDARRCCRGE